MASTKTRITITRALAELKLINKRIADKKVPDVSDIFINNKSKVNGITSEEFIKDTRATINSYIDLLKRRSEIKEAIAKANIENKIKIRDSYKNNTKEIEVTIFSAITIKNTYKDLLVYYNKMALWHTDKQKKHSKTLDELDDKALKITEQLYGNKSSQISKDAIEKIRNDYIKAYDIKLIEVIPSDELYNIINQLEEIITDIDLRLSEVNAKTYIVI